MALLFALPEIAMAHVAPEHSHARAATPAAATEARGERAQELGPGDSAEEARRRAEELHAASQARLSLALADHADVTDRLEATAEELDRAQQSLDAVVTELARARQRVARAAQEEAQALLRAAQQGYLTATAAADVAAFANHAYQSGAVAGELEDWARLAAQGPAALVETALTEKATETLNVAHAEVLADLRVQAQHANTAREAAQAAAERRAAAEEQVRAALRRQRVTVSALQRTRTELDALRDVQGARVKEARRLERADRAALDLLTQEAHQVSVRVQQAINELSPALRRRLGLPATGPLVRPATGHVTSPFGMRRHPVLGYVKLHTGVDFSIGDGFVYAAAKGVVLATTTHVAYGNLTVIAHGTREGRTMTTWYAHQDNVAVTAGQRVRAGQRIGTIGSTGYSTGPHLHFEIRFDDEPVDPILLLPGAGGASAH